MQLYRIHDSRPAGAQPVATKDEAKRWNAEGFGIFMSLGATAWAVDFGADPKPGQRERILRSPLVPSLVIETTSGFQACWVAKAAKPEHYKAIAVDRLAPHFRAQAVDLVRVPGFLHRSFTVRCAWKHNVGYTERQIGEAFRWSPSRTAPIQPAAAAPRPVAALLDAPLERAFVAALIASPDLHDDLPVELGLDTISDLQASSAFAAFANLRARGGQVDHAAIRVELARQAGHHDVEWFDRFAIEPKPPTLVLGWAASIIRLASNRAAAITQDDEQARQDAELDELAMRDADDRMAG